MEKNADFLAKLPFKKGWVHCVGVGGIGVSALAQLLLEGNYKVSGSDLEANSNTRAVTNAGGVVGVGHDRKNLPPELCTGAIISAAVDLKNVEVAELLRQGVLTLRRGEFLGELCGCYRRPVLVAGSHGKSSISAMLGWILRKSGVDAGLLVGAHYNDHNFPYAKLGDGDILIAEADESDGTIALLKGYLAVINNIDGDHAWNREQQTEQEMCFRRYAAAADLTMYVDSADTRRVLGDLPNCRALEAGYLQQLSSMAPERFAGYERSNAAVAMIAAEYLGIAFDQSAALLQVYPGIERRQCETYRAPDDRIIVLEDYAHHPTELAASLELLRERYAQYQLVVVFQPHRYQRLQFYFDDFVRILSAKDLQVKVVPVFSAWSPVLIDGMDHTDLVRAINAAGGNAEVYDKDYNLMAADLAETAKNSAGAVLIALIGAGDVNLLSSQLSDIFTNRRQGG